MRVLTVVGARPQFVKAAPVSRALAAAGVAEVVVDTGQHYDRTMRAVFFEELGLAAPAVDLAVGSGSHAEQTAAALVGIERALLAERPDWVLVYGDTNATLSGALAAAKLGIPTAHVEAGLRSGDRSMPEELNRIVVDHLSTCLLCPSKTAVENLAREGIRENVLDVGDVMVDSLRWMVPRSRAGSLELPDGPFAIATIHRAANTQDPEALRRALDCLAVVPAPVIFPAHPRSRKLLGGLALPGNVRVTEPLSFSQMVHAMQRATLVLTDSGGVQKEAFLLGKRTLTLREETEWVETLEGGWNRLVGTDPERVLRALASEPAGTPDRTVYGDGQAAPRIVETLLARFEEART